MQKRQKTWLIFSLLMYKETRELFLFQRQFLFVFLRYQLHPCVQRCAWQNVQNVFLIEHTI